ncbi:succinate dehydrogenase cytochrome b560 subunit [Fomitiporia mediterranea MF3/22]|uniref:succinate dehydrogenase cytochrome b560 subunit n=1 Tax=Fomitiporia mediterranea (strain MF3/22) TaxID=694068 RepID=UPI00044086DD|nr:succinate dehydrogenase cytochrome b560 subunit [Fomitiporia mediterranea MF3/22]EJD06471.1 succinate dehydrogenase cytochrome b560 subunit [Fomitiporia mediterranea MF3/22]
MSTMMSTRFVGLAPALRRATFRSSLARNHALLCNSVFKRGVQIEFQQPAKANDILNSQRLKRPSSPHFTIYQPQLTWYGSIANRITGTALSVLLYGFTISYVVFPLVGAPFSSTDVIQLVSTLPEGVKYAGKALLAAPFAFHSWNGLRHLAWDSGKFLTLKGAYATGYAVLGASAVTTVALVLL